MQPFPAPVPCAAVSPEPPRTPPDRKRDPHAPDEPDVPEEIPPAREPPDRTPARRDPPTEPPDPEDPKPHKIDDPPAPGAPPEIIA